MSYNDLQHLSQRGGFRNFLDWEEVFKQEMMLERIARPSRFGIEMLDRNIMLSGNKICVVVGRSEMGKTSFMAHMISRQLQDGKRVLLYSCEEFGASFISRLTNNFMYPIPVSAKLNFIMKDNSTTTLEEIVEDFCILSELGPMMTPDIVYIDQLNKIILHDFQGSKHDRVVKVSEMLAGVVKEIKRPLVIAHQANRAAIAQKGFITEEFLADADAVFREATIVLTIESQDYIKWNRDKKIPRSRFQYYINVAKNRALKGWKGAAPIIFDRETGIFYDIEKEKEYLLKLQRTESNESGSI